MIAGNSILYLPVCTSLNDNDLILVSSRDKYIHDIYDSVHLSARDFMQFLIKSIVAELHLGTMSSENENSYSTIDHKHDEKYNKLDISIPLSPDPSKYDLSTLMYNADPQWTFTGYPIVKPRNDLWLSIGNMFVDGRLSTTYIPLSCAIDYAIIPWQMIEPGVGDVKFMALNTICSNADIDYKSTSFDGWLYPDGITEFDLTSFCLSNHISDIPNITYNEETLTFKLPALTSFAMLREYDDQFSIFQYNSWSTTGMPEHFHYADIVANGTVETTAQVDVASNAGPGGKLHQGNGHSNYINVRLNQTYNGHRLREYLSAYANNILTLGPRGDVDNNPYAGMSARELWSSEVFNENIVKTDEMNITCYCNVQLTSAGAINDSDSALYRETYPSYSLMPIMMYVGKNNRMM